MALFQSDESNNYIPIYLSNIICKILEYSILNRITKHIPIIIIIDNQFGYKPKHGIDLGIFITIY